VFRRGFVEEYAGSMRAFLRDDGDFWPGVPLHTLRLTPNAPLAPLGALPCLCRLRILEFGDRRFHWEFFNANVLRDLAGSPHLSGVISLRIRVQTPPSGGSVPLLTTTGWLGRLRELDLSENHLRDEDAGRLVSTPDVAGLSVLNLAGNDISNAGAQALAASPNLAGLRTLVLGRNRIGKAGVRRLRKSRHLAGLTTLDLSDNRGD
jgi:hypothetical protein